MGDEATWPEPRLTRAGPKMVCGGRGVGEPAWRTKEKGEEDICGLCP